MTTAVEVRERPILFSGPMVRAILDGHKTQTRRVVKPQPPEWWGGPVECGRFHPTIIDRYGEEEPGDEIFGAWACDGEWGWKSPYGQPGDRLWVREGFIRHTSIPQLVGYVADGCDVTEQWERRFPSIHMPRRFSRITLEITDVRVERVQDITEDDARAEGVCELAPVMGRDPGERNYATFTDGWTLRGAFSLLWDQINGPRGFGWCANPWVWVVSFRRIDQ